MASFEIGGIAIAQEAGNRTITQTYAPKRPGSVLSMGDGSSQKQQLAGAVGKLVTTLAGAEAWAPPGLAGLDYTQSHVLKCAAPRAVSGATNVITVPAARRSDTGHTPVGFAIVGENLVSTTINIVVNEATLGTVTGASGYVVHYWPQIIVFATLRENLTQGSAHFGWSLTCEEV